MSLMVRMLGCASHLLDTCWTARRASSNRSAPVARRRITPWASRTNVVGVRLTRSRRTRSRCDSASMSTWTTPSAELATCPRTWRLARHGWQKAVENCTNVARTPRARPRSSAVSRTSSLVGRGFRSRPSTRRRHNPTAVAPASATTTMTTPSTPTSTHPRRPPVPGPGSK